MQATFQFHLHQPILDRTAQIGKFDGKHPSLACGTSAGKVFIYSPNEQVVDSIGKQQIPLRYLKINRNVSSLAIGKFHDTDFHDTLVVGTESSILAYDVEKNSDIFYRDVPDGVNILLFAPTPTLCAGGISSQMLVTGGNCSIQGFNKDGNEIFWTVTGDNVRALANGDVTGIGRDELLVGSDDFEIRAYQGEDTVYERTETAKIIAIAPIKKQMFAYALDNGTTGVYRGKHRAWRVKSKNIPKAICAFDIDGDGEKELIIGWSNGKLEARRISNGDVVNKDYFNAPIAAILCADYRMLGYEELICCASDGEVRGYYSAIDSVPSVLAMTERATSEEREVIKLSRQRTLLQSELKSLEALNGGPAITAASLYNALSTGSTAQLNQPSKPATGLRIPADTCVKVACVSTQASTAYELEVLSHPDTIIKMIIINEYDAGIFESGEAFIARPTSSPSSIVKFSLPITKSVAAKLELKILIGNRGNSSTFHTMETTYTLPAFAMYYQLPSPSKDTIPFVGGKLQFKTPVKVNHMLTWVNLAFHVKLDTPSKSEQKSSHHFAHLAFRSLKDGSPLHIVISTTETCFYTPNMTLAAHLVQHLCTHLEWRDLESIAEFPEQISAFKTLLTRVEECNAVRQKLTGEMADDSHTVKSLIIRAEDSRLLNNMSQMRRYYADLFTLNNQLLGEFTKRSTNHQALLESLKEVNNMIQLAASLRYGAPKATVISACRKAVKNNNIQALFYIIKTGREEIH